MMFFMKIEKNLKFGWNYKIPQIGNTILSDNNKTDTITFSYYKAHYKAYNKNGMVLT